MRGVILAVVLLVASVVALPAAGFLTARNAPPVACGASASLALAQMSDAEATTAHPSIDPTLSGREMVEAAAAIWFPAADVPVAVAIAGAESSFNPDPPNPPTVAGGTMRGLWQINDGAHPDLVNAPGRDWRNPVDNAWMAFQVWKRAGRSWTPWSTYNSGSYRRFLTDSDTSPTSQTQTRQQPALDCGDIDATIVTWNSGAWNSTRRVVEGFAALARTADVIAGQELGSESRRKMIMKAVGGEFSMYPQPPCKGRDCRTRKGTSVPILVRNSKFDVVQQGRDKAIPHKVRAEHGSDGNSVGPEVRHLGDPARQVHRQPVLRGQHPPDRVGHQR